LSLYNIVLSLPAAVDDMAAASFAPALNDRALAATAMRRDNNHRAAWTLTWLLEERPGEAEISELLTDAAAEAGLKIEAQDWRIEPVADINWLEHSYRQFQPFTVGDFFIYGSHHDGAVPAGKLPLLIDAATAFGSGEHGTTAGCLRLLLALKDEGYTPRNILDMGAGSGILAVASARLWGAPVLAADIDEESVIVAARHAALNGVADKITCLQSDGFESPALKGKIFSLVIANILAGPLIAMAADLCAATTPGGKIILSGMLAEQADEVRGVYEGLGCRSLKTLTIDPWTSLLLENPVA
jgi:ribosomal protein L11 methyltransferase